LRSSPAWNGRCWRGGPARHARPADDAILTGLEWPVLAVTSHRTEGGSRWCCDPHRLGMAGAGAATAPDGIPVISGLRSSPAWNGRCWQRHILGCGRVSVLGSSPSWNGRCWAPRRRLPPHAAAGVAILTGLEWPVLGQARSRGRNRNISLRSSPSWNGRCWTDSLPAIRKRGHVAILTVLEWPVLAVSDTVGDDARLEVAILTGLEWPVLVE